jgi:hypothetical protein
MLDSLESQLMQRFFQEFDLLKKKFKVRFFLAKQGAILGQFSS